jgi:hypothetical protein
MEGSAPFFAPACTGLITHIAISDSDSVLARFSAIAAMVSLSECFTTHACTRCTYRQAHMAIKSSNEYALPYRVC